MPDNDIIRAAPAVVGSATAWLSPNEIASLVVSVLTAIYVIIMIAHKIKHWNKK